VNNQRCPRSVTANDALRYQRLHITADNLEWLKNSVSKIEFDGASFVHGGWRDPLDEYLMVVSDEYFRNESATYFFSGHTHIQSANILATLSHCNPGSVGQPRDNDPKAAFALFDGERIYLRRVHYDIDKVAVAMEHAGFNRYFYEGLYAGLRIGQTRVNSQ
jgi:diadenosine tetraphosphatase ApaH/serine/threonine PP2A family protein phosphatase